MHTWNSRYLTRLDWRMIFVIVILMIISLLVISSHTQEIQESPQDSFFTPVVKQQLQWFIVGFGIYFLIAGFDYNKLREWTWILYALMLISLLGLFFVDPIQRVHRWYKIPLLQISVQPSEYAKLITVIALSWFLERKRTSASSWSTAFFGGLIVLIPFILILKQPDLGTALVLIPITLVMFYFGNVKAIVYKSIGWLCFIALVFVALMFTGTLSHEKMRPYALQFLKEYQYERLDPNTHHQKAAVTAVAIGGLTGTGWKKSEFASGGWLPMPYTDSVFPAFAEEFGLIGLTFLLAIFYALIFFSFQVSAVAKDLFGRLLAAGIGVYLAMHILINIGMMIGFLPITGVPLILITYGGSSVLSTMAALGLLQSIYSRRFMF